MAELGNGVFVTNDAQVSVEPSSAVGARRRRSAAALDTDQFDLDQVLREAEFELAADLTIAPARTRRSFAGEAQQAPQIEVELAADEDAVLLIEQQGGVYRWTWPRETEEAGRQRRSAFPRRAVFDLIPPDGEPADEAAGSRRRRGVPFAGWIAEQLIEPIRVRVLRFAARIATDALIDRVEGHVEQRPIRWDPDALRWTAGLPDLSHLPNPRILLVVHGTFSSTANSFGRLAMPDHGGDQLAQAYDAIIGFDHKTLALDPLQNAQAMAGAFAGLPQDAEIEAIAYSRGGLVYRAFEQTFGAARPDVRFGKALFVGCTNSGTYLADPANWKALVDLYTTIALAGIRGAAVMTGFAGGEAIAFVIRSIGDFVKIMPELAVTDGKVPGLAAMLPGGDFVRSIGTRPADLERYYAMVSDFRPRIEPSRGLTAEIIEFVANRVGDRFFGQPNDLVVHTASMTDFGSAGTLPPSRVYTVPVEHQVYHTVYFSGERLFEPQRKMLLGMPMMSAPEQAALPPAPPPPPAPLPAAAPPPPVRRMRRSSPPGGQANGVESGKKAAPALPDAPRPTEVHFAARMEADPPAAEPIKLGITISPEVIELIAGQIMDRTEAAVDVDPDQLLVIEVTPLANAKLLTEGRREIAVPRATVTEWFLVEGFEPGAARIQIEARQADRTLALLLLEPVFVNGGAEQLVAAQTFTASQPGQDEPTYLRIYEIEEPGGKTVIRYNIESRKQRFAEIGESDGLPKVEVDHFFAEFLKMLDESWNLGPEAYANRKQELLDIASETADRIIPEPVRTALWDNRDTIEAIQVVADQSTIPWELLSITPPRGGAGDGRFLSEWGLLRRLPGAPWPGRVIDLDPAKARYVIPDYLDDQHDLQFAQQEIGNFTRHFPGAQPLKADSRAVRDFLGSGAKDCSVLHFACHGSAKQGTILSAGLKMQEDKEIDGQLVDNTLSHQAVRRDSSFGTSGPSGLVFLNACEAGKQGTHLQSDAVGFADAFLRPKSKQGAAAFIGAMWQIDDELALVFADTFYGAMLSGKTLAQAIGAARKAIEREFDFTWLAFTAYGDPFTIAKQRNR